MMRVLEYKASFTYGPLQADQVWHRAWVGAWPRCAPVYTIGAEHRANSIIDMAALNCRHVVRVLVAFLKCRHVTELRWLVGNDYENSNLKKLFDVEGGEGREGGERGRERGREGRGGRDGGREGREGREGWREGGRDGREGGREGWEGGEGGR